MTSHFNSVILKAGQNTRKCANAAKGGNAMEEAAGSANKLKGRLNGTNSQDELSKRLVTSKELAKKLNLPESWVRWRSCLSCPEDKRIPSLRIGRYRRYVIRQVLKWLKSQHDPLRDSETG